MRDSSGWRPTAYRSHTIGRVVANGADMVGSEVTVAGYAETVRGRGAICFLMLRDGTGRILGRIPPGQGTRGFEHIQGVTRLRSRGNSTTSRTFPAPVSTMSRRATPSPHPACGGAP